MGNGNSFRAHFWGDPPLIGGRISNCVIVLSAVKGHASTAILKKQVYLHRFLVGPVILQPLPSQYSLTLNSIILTSGSRRAKLAKTLHFFQNFPSGVQEASSISHADSW